LAFSALSGMTAWLSSRQPAISIAATVVLGFIGFWFVPEILDRPLHWAAMRRLRLVAGMKDASVPIPATRPDFRQSSWAFKFDGSELTATSD